MVNLNIIVYGKILFDVHKKCEDELKNSTAFTREYQRI